MNRVYDDFAPHHHLGAESDFAVSAHAEAAAKLLCRIVRELRTGRAPEELGAQVIEIGAMMERKL